MLQLDNQTPFEAAMAVLPDPEGVDTLYPAVKATFRLPPPGSAQLEVAEEQLPVAPADEHRGDPRSTGLLRAGELHPSKPATDVVLLGSARAPRGRPVDRLDVSLRVGPVATTVRVWGDRRWVGGAAGATPSSPRPFAALPLLWERAFGGVRETADGGLAGEPRNPAGVGHPAGRPRRDLVGTPVPNLEDPRRPIRGLGDRPAPAGFGFVAPSWAPRAGYAGTYDEAWRRRRAPFLPEDFDPRFFQVAAPGLTAPGFLAGGEPVRIDHVAHEGPLGFRLPRCELAAEVTVAGAVERPPLRLETVLIEPDSQSGGGRLVLLWRAALRCDKRMLRIETVRLRLLALDLGAGRPA